MLLQFLLPATFFSVFLLFAPAMTNDAEKVLEKMASVLRPGSYHAEMKITTVRPDYVRELDARSWNINGDLRIIMITAPARDKGMTYLVSGSGIWKYLPQNGKINQVHSTMFTQSWLGSDFLNCDLIGNISYLKENYTISPAGSGMIADSDCHVIELSPRPESCINTGIMKIWVTKDNYQHLKTEYYDKDGKATRMISLSYLKGEDGREMPSRIEIKPAKQGCKTIIEITNMILDPDTQNKVFADQTLRNIVELLPAPVLEQCFTLEMTEK